MNISKSLVIPPPKRRQPEYLIARSLPAVQIGTSMTTQHTDVMASHMKKPQEHGGSASGRPGTELLFESEHRTRCTAAASSQYWKGNSLLSLYYRFFFEGCGFQLPFPLRGYLTLVLSADAVLKTSNKISLLSLASLRIV